MPILFNCLVAILFLLAYNSVYAAELRTYVQECTEECKKNAYASKECGGLCRNSGAQSLYCHLRCSKYASTSSEYDACKWNCKSQNLYPAKCVEDCTDITRLPHMCHAICEHDDESLLNRCLYSCVSKLPPQEECEDPVTGGVNCENPDYRPCSNQCYTDDKKYLESLQ